MNDAQYRAGMEQEIRDLRKALLTCRAELCETAEKLRTVTKALDRLGSPLPITQSVHGATAGGGDPSPEGES